MKMSFIFALILTAVAGAYYSAQNKISEIPDLRSLHLGMTVADLKDVFGAPVYKDHNQLTYLFDDSSHLIITLRENEVASAQLKFNRPLQISDPQLKKLHLVQMELKNNDDMKWFFAGNPEEGLIYKVTTSGVIESITWVPPFTYTGKAPKQRIGALLRDFKDKVH
jgi:hypothetical protein